SCTAYSGSGCWVVGAARRCSSRSPTLTPRCSASNSSSRARLRALVRAAMSVHAAEVGTVAGVDLDLGAGLEEEGDLDLGTGLDRGRLGAAGGAVPLQARLG